MDCEVVMVRKEVVRAYNKVRDKDYLSWNAVEFAGRYLSEYPCDPMTPLADDIIQMKVPGVLGDQIKAVVMAVMKNEGKGE